MRQVVCQSCSSNKCDLEYLKNQMARVCDQCFLVLRQQNSKYFGPSPTRALVAGKAEIIRAFRFPGEQVPSSSASPGNRAPLAFARKQKRIPAALKEVTTAPTPPPAPASPVTAVVFQVSANTDSSMSGYLQRSKGGKKHWKRLWFVIKDKVLYTYAASEVSSPAGRFLGRVPPRRLTSVFCPPPRRTWLPWRVSPSWASC